MASPWQLDLQPASYNGAMFHIEVQSRAGGRRNVEFEFPKRDIPYAEDMGRRARKFTITAYVIQGPDNGYDYRPDRDDLIAALEAENPGLLILPTGLALIAGDSSGMVAVDTYAVTERRERGGYAEFEITFAEAGTASVLSPVADTQGIVNSTAQDAIGAFQDSSDLTTLSAVATV